MFNQTFVEAGGRTGKPYSIGLSLILQIGAIAIAILIPILYTQTLPSAQLKSFILAPPPPPAPVKALVQREISRAVTRTVPLQWLTAPAKIPARVNQVNDVPSTPDLGGGGIAGDASGSSALLFGTVPTAPPPSPPAAPIKAAVQSGPIRVGGLVAEANVIKRVQPVYPVLAKSARVQGTVEFTAVISKDGRVENLQLVRGHPLLVNAARDAILQWQYRPTKLNGEPVEVATTITVNFTLSQ